MKTMQVDETQKKRKHTTKYLIITLTEDDVEFNADKLEDRGEVMVFIAEAQRENIMEIYNNYGVKNYHGP